MGTHVRPWGLVVACALVSGLAGAEPNPEAEKLFRDARALLKAGKLPEACDAFAASSRLEPSVGTLLNLGDCRAKLGQTATAWAAFAEAGRLAKREHDAKRQAEADKRVAELDAKLSYLTIQLAPDAKMAGMAITRAGTPVDDALLGHAMPIDPGDYEIRATVAGFVDFSSRVTVGPDADKKTVVIQRLHKYAPIGSEVKTGKPDGAKPDGSKPDAPAKPETKPDDEPAAPPPPSSFTPMRKAAIGVGAVGVIGLGVSTVLALGAKSLEDEARSVCPAGMPCRDMAAAQKSKDAVSKANVATIVGGVGLAAIAAGVVMWVVGKPHATEASREAAIVPVVTPDAVGFGVVGRF
jgi:hypothetical protein